MPSASQSACLRIGNHRAQLVFGDGAVILTERHTIQRSTTPDEVSHTVHVRDEGVHPPADYPYGERQYTADDIGSHRWTFSQSIADVAPEAWGAILGKLE
ncbi:MAG: hypothetical protein ACXWQ5_21450 [Ktedonobacterales bacterium]